MPRLIAQLLPLLALLTLGAAPAWSQAVDPYADNPFPVAYRTAPIDPVQRWAGYQSRVGTYLPTDPYHFWRFDITNRAEVQDVYWREEMVGATVPKDWNGSYTTLEPGKTTQAWRNACLREVNLHRYMNSGGLANYVAEDLTWNGRMQAAAFIMGWNGYYSHTVPDSMIPAGFKYTVEARAGAMNSLGAAGDAYDLTGYISDIGNPFPGHRIAMFDPAATVAATGDVGANGVFLNTPFGAANALRTSNTDVDATNSANMPPPPQGDPFKKYQVYPYSGFNAIDVLAADVIPFSIDLFSAGLRLDTSAIKITVKINGVALPDSKIHLQPAGYANSFRQVLSFTVDHGFLGTSNADHGYVLENDVSFEVTVENLRFRTDLATPDQATYAQGLAIFLQTGVEPDYQKLYTAKADPSAFQNHTIAWSFTVYDPFYVKPASYQPKCPLTSLSTRASVGQGDNVLISGFIVDSTNGSHEPLRVAVRAQGPSLKQYGLQNTATNPKISIYQTGGPTLGGNDDWQQGANWRLVQSFGLNPQDSKEPVAVATLAPGAYTAVVSDPTGGVGIAEVFAIDSQSASRLSGVSTRGIVGTGEAVMIAGLQLQTTTALVIRTQGPSLAQYGVSGVVSGTKLTLVRQSDGAVLNVNTGWNAAGNERLKTDLAYLAPADNREAALVVTLPPGAYTALVESTSGQPGVGIVEAFQVN
jgi:hypothetical protein